MGSMIRFEHVSKKYQLGSSRTSLPTLLSGWLKSSFKGSILAHTADQTFWALRDVSFAVEQGDSLALVGANGAGKTTILKLLANITKPSAGTIKTHGKLSALIELAAGFHPDLTGRENIYLNGAILGLNRKAIARRFDEIVDFSELEPFIDTPVKRYSSGMTVRLGFAVASCIEPDILLVDEVLAVGDASFQQKCMGRIRTLLKDGASIIFVSHNFYLVQAVCNKGLYLNHGEVCYYGPTQEVIGVYEQDLHQERALKLMMNGQHASNHEGDKVEITEVELLGIDKAAPTAYFSSQAPVQIRIHYNAYQPLGRVHASVFIMRADGLTCCMMRTKLDGFELDVARGQGVVTVTLNPLQLVSGAYFAEAWFLNDSDSIGITTKPGRSAWFTVKGAGLSYTETSGIFEPHTSWSHQAGTDHPSMIVHDRLAAAATEEVRR